MQLRWNAIALKGEGEPGILEKDSKTEGGEASGGDQTSPSAPGQCQVHLHNSRLGNKGIKKGP